MIRWLHAIREEEEGAFGPKAAGLARAIELGMRVAPGFALNAQDLEALESKEGWRAFQEALSQLEEMERFRGVPLAVALRPSGARLSGSDRSSLLGVGVKGESLEALGEWLGETSLALDLRRRFLKGFAKLLGKRGHLRAGERLFETFDHSWLEREVGALEEEVGLAGASSEDELRQALFLLAKGTPALVVQVMRYGVAKGGHSGAGVAASHHPLSGEAGLYGEIVWGRMGEDLTLGRRLGCPIRKEGLPEHSESLEVRLPRLYSELDFWIKQGEKAMDCPVSLEFVIEREHLWVVQFSPWPLAGSAEVRYFVERVKTGSLGQREALLRIRPDALNALARLEVEKESHAAIGVGLAASPGAASGLWVVENEEAERALEKGSPYVLVRHEIGPEDAMLVRKARAVVTLSGGLTSHAAVMCRALGKPCVVSLRGLKVVGRQLCRFEGTEVADLKAGWLTVDGSRGRVYEGIMPLRRVGESWVEEVLGWAEGHARVPLLLWAELASEVAKLGADGWFDGERAWDKEGQERPEWRFCMRWSPGEPWPQAEAVLVEPEFLVAARLRAAQAALCVGNPQVPLTKGKDK
ncbi:MAG: PEP-utilizing enzyme [Sandaracinaceae bacterium]|nr:PEP-utilizing enzyme [Sandaracinaceae bacterium]